jgi:hypothetical protein
MIDTVSITAKNLALELPNYYMCWVVGELFSFFTFWLYEKLLYIGPVVSYIY